MIHEYASAIKSFHSLLSIFRIFLILFSQYHTQEPYSNWRRSCLNRKTFLPPARTFLVAASAAGGALAAGLSPADAAPAGKERACSWFKNTRRMLHLDSHFSGFSDIYNGFDAERTARMYTDAGFQMVSYFAKCWGGFSYYPTKIGIVHPTCRVDYTGELTAALKKRGGAPHHLFHDDDRAGTSETASGMGGQRRSLQLGAGEYQETGSCHHVLQLSLCGSGRHSPDEGNCEEI